MSDLYTQVITVFMSFFAIMNPIANTAAFSGLVGDRSKSEQRKVASKALLITFFIILAFSVLGKAIFHLFGITIDALRITGGILVFVVGYHMLNGHGSKLHSAEGDDEDDLAVSPLAVPLLAGPGTIATAMNYSAAGGFMGILTTVSVFAVLCLITFICFIYSSTILSLIGKSGLSIVTRLMGLILAVIGVQMLIVGLMALVNKVS
ncbi:MAG: MarC family protein [Oceanospirillaceae bacterium]|nr:MarC family protein [Oceanospirillaceae bacterium]